MNKNDDAESIGSSDSSSLDLFSSKLNVLKVLNVKDKKKVKNLNLLVKPLDALYKTRALLSVDDPNYLFNKRAAKANSNNNEEENNTNKKVKLSTIQRKYENPLNRLADSFKNGPFSFLKKNFNLPIKLKVKKTHETTATIEGVLIGFDFHGNVLLTHVKETFQLFEYCIISKRNSGTLNDKICRFLRDFGSEEEKSNAELVEKKAEILLNRFENKKEEEIWKHLQSEYQLIKNPLLIGHTNPQALLDRRRGNENQLFLQLAAKKEKKKSTQNKQRSG